MPHLLFVCTGNICRSPFAERYAAHLTEQGRWPDGWTFASAGTGAVVGAPMEEGMAQRLTGHGGSADGFAARQVVADLVEGADWIVTMEVRHRQWILEEWPATVRRCFTLGQLLVGLEAVDGATAGEEALAAVGDRRPRASRSVDVADPYGRGARAATVAADRIVADLERLADRLSRPPGVRGQTT